VTRTNLIENSLFDERERTLDFGERRGDNLAIKAIAEHEAGYLKGLLCAWLGSLSLLLHVSGVWNGKP
jgi:hypothetical protein